MAAAKSGSREGEGRLRRAAREDPLPATTPRRGDARAPEAACPLGEWACPLPRPASTTRAAAATRGSPIPHPRAGKWRREAEGGEGVHTTEPPPASLSQAPRQQPPRGRPVSRRSPGEAAGRLPLGRQRPRHALSNNSLISNPLPPSRTQSLQPDFPQPSEMREISADEHEPDSSWRCSENCRCSRNCR